MLSSPFLYAPLIVLLLGYFQIQHVAIGVLIFGLIWLLSIKQKTLQNIIFPSFYCAVALIAFFLNDFIIFKFLNFADFAFLYLFSDCQLF